MVEKQFSYFNWNTLQTVCMFIHIIILKRLELNIKMDEMKMAFLS